MGEEYGLYPFMSKETRHGINHRLMHINLQEAHVIIMFLFNMRHRLTGRTLLLYVDDLAVMFSTFKHWSGSLSLMEFIQEIVLLMYVLGLE